VVPVSRSRGLGRGEVKPRTHTASPKGYVSLHCGLLLLTIHFSQVALHFFCFRFRKIEKQIRGNAGIGENRFGFHLLTFDLIGKDIRSLSCFCCSEAGLGILLCVTVTEGENRRANEGPAGTSSQRQQGKHQ